MESFEKTLKKQKKKKKMWTVFPSPKKPNVKSIKEIWRAFQSPENLMWRVMCPLLTSKYQIVASTHSSSNEGLNGLMEGVGLTGFGFIGIVITWPNKRIRDQNIKEHLDKIVVNIVRWTHVRHLSIIHPFVPFFNQWWIWVRALCASTMCVSMDICLQLYEDICMLGIGFVPSPWIHIYVIYISLIASAMRL